MAKPQEMTTWMWMILGSGLSAQVLLGHSERGTGGNAEGVVHFVNPFRAGVHVNVKP